jgi:hypothetical protein
MKNSFPIKRSPIPGRIRYQKETRNMWLCKAYCVINGRAIPVSLKTFIKVGVIKIAEEQENSRKKADNRNKNRFIF